MHNDVKYIYMLMMKGYSEDLMKYDLEVAELILEWMIEDGSKRWMNA